MSHARRLERMELDSVVSVPLLDRTFFGGADGRGGRGGSRRGERGTGERDGSGGGRPLVGAGRPGRAQGKLHRRLLPQARLGHRRRHQGPRSHHLRLLGRDLCRRQRGHGDRAAHRGRGPAGDRGHRDGAPRAGSRRACTPSTSSSTFRTATRSRPWTRRGSSRGTLLDRLTPRRAAPRPFRASCVRPSSGTTREVGVGVRDAGSSLAEPGVEAGLDPVVEARVPLGVLEDRGPEVHRIGGAGAGACPPPSPRAWTRAASRIAARGHRRCTRACSARGWVPVAKRMSSRTSSRRPRPPRDPPRAELVDLPVPDDLDGMAVDGCRVEQPPVVLGGNHRLPADEHVQRLIRRGPPHHVVPDPFEPFEREPKPALGAEELVEVHGAARRTSEGPIPGWLPGRAGARGCPETGGGRRGPAIRVGTLSRERVPIVGGHHRVDDLRDPRTR